MPLVLLLMRDHPADVGLQRLRRADRRDPGRTPAPRAGQRPRARCAVLRSRAARTRPFWLLAGGFAICGATTNGLVGTHFIPAAHDHGMPITDRRQPARAWSASSTSSARSPPAGSPTGSTRGSCSAATTRCAGCRCWSLPALLAPHTHPSMLVFIIFYGLDWVATVPPTVALCRQHFGATAPIVFGWVFASHQVGAAVAATGAGFIRDVTGTYDLAFYLGAGLCVFAAAMCAAIGATARGSRQPR